MVHLCLSTLHENKHENVLRLLDPLNIMTVFTIDFFFIVCVESSWTISCSVLGGETK